MARLLKPFPESPLKLLGFGTTTDRRLSLPASLTQATALDAVEPLVLPTNRPRASLADSHGWQHGGINE
jgi:hypothetical protein